MCIILHYVYYLTLIMCTILQYVYNLTLCVLSYTMYYVYYLTLCVLSYTIYLCMSDEHNVDFHLNKF